MLNTCFNKTTHPILNRYHHNRMVQGTNLIKEMDTMINKISKNQTIDISEEDKNLFLSESKQKTRGKRSYSKGVMKKIINNQTWNDLIDRRYNQSHLTRTRSSQINPPNRSKSLKSSSKNFSPSKVNLPNLNLSQTMISTANKIKKEQCNMLEYFNPLFQSKYQKIVNKLAKPPTKVTKKYRNRQLKWQNKHLTRYQEDGQFQSQKEL